MHNPATSIELYPLALEQPAIGEPQVEISPALTDRQQLVRQRAERTADGLDDVIADRIVIGTDGRPEPGQQIRRLAPEGIPHRTHCLRDDLPGGPQPPGMHKSNSLPGRVIQEDRHTICEPHEQRDLRIGGDHGIGLHQGLLPAWCLRVHDIGGMHLPDLVQALLSLACSLQNPPLVLEDFGAIIANGSTEVERCPRGRAHPPTPGESCVLEAGPI